MIIKEVLHRSQRSQAEVPKHCHMKITLKWIHKFSQEMELKQLCETTPEDGGKLGELKEGTQNRRNFGFV